MRLLIFIGLAGLAFAFYAGYTGTLKSQNKSVAGKSVEGLFMMLGVVVVIIGYFVAAWVLKLFTPLPDDLPIPQDYAP